MTGELPRAPEVRPEELANMSARDSSGIDRRDFLLLTGGLAAVGLVANTALDAYAFDHTLPRLGYTRFHTTIETATPPNVNYPSQFGLSFPGTGQYPELAHQAAIELGNGPYRKQGFKYVALANDGIDFDELAAAYEQHERQAEYIDLQVTSSGLLLMARTLARKEERLAAAGHGGNTTMAVYAPVRKQIRSLLVLAGTTCIDDVYHGSSIAQVIKRLNPTGTLSQKMSIKILDRMIKHGESWGTALDYAKQAAFDDIPAGMYLDQLHMLVDNDIFTYQSILRRYLSPWSRVAYVRPRNPLDDTTVKVVQASQKVATLTRSCGAQFKEVLLPNAGHADINKTVGSRAVNGFVEDNFQRI